MAWTRIEITEAALLGGTYHRICRRFQHAFIAAGAPDGMALFAQTFSIGDTRTLYLTPASREHLGDLHAQGQPCPAPAAQDVTLVFGVPGAERTLLAPFALGAPEGDVNASLRAPARADAARPDTPYPASRLPETRTLGWGYAAAP